MFVDPNTKTFPSSSLSSPSRSERNSFFSRFEASCSFEHLFAVKLSNSSMKIIDGAWNLASSNNTRTNFSDSPRHFEIKVLAAMLKNVKVSWVSEHKALANVVLPQPGTPWSKTAANDRETRLLSIIERLCRLAFVPQTFPRLNATEQLRVFHGKYRALLYYHFGIILTSNVLPFHA